jgi:hypothetical protein
VNLAAPNAHGGWRLGTLHNQQTAGYVFEVPAYFADRHLGGRRLIAGLTGVAGIATSSAGPALIAFAPWKHGAQPPPAGAALDALPLALYEMNRPLPGWKIPDFWGGAAWVSAGRKHAVVIGGRVGIGPVRYGGGAPGDCSQANGYHSDPYEPRLAFYDPDDLASVASGARAPNDVVPYVSWNPMSVLYPTCEWTISGVAYDRESALLYLAQQFADVVSDRHEPMPLLHVFRVRGS